VSTATAGANGATLVVRDRRSRNGTRVDGNFVEGAELRIGIADGHDEGGKTTAYLRLGRSF